MVIFYAFGGQLILRLMNADLITSFFYNSVLCCNNYYDFFSIIILFHFFLDVAIQFCLNFLILLACWKFSGPQEVENCVKNEHTYILKNLSWGPLSRKILFMIRSSVLHSRNEIASCAIYVVLEYTICILCELSYFFSEFYLEHLQFSCHVLGKIRGINLLYTSYLNKKNDKYLYLYNTRNLCRALYHQQWRCNLCHHKCLLLDFHCCWGMNNKYFF